MGSKYKVSGVAEFQTYGRRKTFWVLSNGENLPRHAAARGQPNRLAEPELDLVQPLINVDLRELTWALIKENIEAPSMATASISTIGRAVRDRFRRKGKWLRKRWWGQQAKNSLPIIKLDTLIECKDSLDWSNASFSLLFFKRTWS